MAIFVDENVLWFEVSVNDTSSMQIAQTIEQLVHEQLRGSHEEREGAMVGDLDVLIGQLLRRFDDRVEVSFHELVDSVQRREQCFGCGHGLNR
jgi:hypothetical protein